MDDELKMPVIAERCGEKRYRAVLFDMDGIVADSMDYHAEGWQQVLREYCGLELSREDIFKREGMPGLESIVDIFEEKGVPVPSEEALTELRERKLQLFERHEIAVFPTIRDILDLLSRQRIAMGLVTGSLRRSVQHVLRDDVLRYFEAVVTVDDIAKGKPDPEPYLCGIARLGVAKSDVLAVENAPMGVISAKRAGIDCFAIETTLDERFLTGADRVFRNHRDLYDCFCRMYNTI